MGQNAHCSVYFHNQRAMLVIFYSFTSKLKKILVRDFILHMWAHSDAILITTCFHDSLGHSKRERLGRLESCLRSFPRRAGSLKDHTQPKCIAGEHCTGAIFCNTDKTSFPMVFDHRTVSLQSAETGCCRWFLDVL